MARELDYKSAAAWIGHPYFDVIDNSTDFETKINRMLECVCQKLGIDTGDRLLRTSRKQKFLGKNSGNILIKNAHTHRKHRTQTLYAYHFFCECVCLPWFLMSNSSVFRTRHKVIYFNKNILLLLEHLN